MDSTEHAYPRVAVDAHTAGTGTTYDPATGIMSVTTTAAHGMRNGDWIKMSEGFYYIQLCLWWCIWTCCTESISKSYRPNLQSK